MRKSRRLAAALALAGTLAATAPALAAPVGEGGGRSGRPDLVAWIVDLFASIVTPAPPVPATESAPPEDKDSGPESDPHG